MEVKVHLGEGFLHVTDVVGGVADKIGPMPPVRPKDTDLVVGAERAGEEPVGMEALEPLAIRDIGFASGHVLHMPGIHELYLEPVLF